MPAPRNRRLAAIAIAAVAILVGGCGSSASTSADNSIQPAPSANGSPPAPVASTPTTPANPALAKKPSIAKPAGPAPAKLVVRDLVTGTGPVIKTGQTLTVQYVGVLYRTGKQFQASWDSGQPFTFAFGTGNVIPGWDMGLVGMHVGGRRQLIIPASLAYKSTARPGIPANSPLIFDIDLLSAQ